VSDLAQGDSVRARYVVLLPTREFVSTVSKGILREKSLPDTGWTPAFATTAMPLSNSIVRGLPAISTFLGVAPVMACSTSTQVVIG